VPLNVPTKKALCMSFTDKGACHRGDACTYAHGSHQIPNYKRGLLVLA